MDFAGYLTLPTSSFIGLTLISRQTDTTQLLQRLLFKARLEAAYCRVLQ